MAFTDKEVTDYRSAFAADKTRARAFTMSMFDHRIFLNPMSTKLYVSLAHSEEDIARLQTAARDVLAGL